MARPKRRPVRPGTLLARSNRELRSSRISRRFMSRHDLAPPCMHVNPSYLQQPARLAHCFWSPEGLSSIRGSLLYLVLVVGVLPLICVWWCIPTTWTRDGFQHQLKRNSETLLRTIVSVDAHIDVRISKGARGGDGGSRQGSINTVPPYLYALQRRRCRRIPRPTPHVHAAKTKNIDGRRAAGGLNEPQHCTTKSYYKAIHYQRETTH